MTAKQLVRIQYLSTSKQMVEAYGEWDNITVRLVQCALLKCRISEQSMRWLPVARPCYRRVAFQLIKLSSDGEQHVCMQ